MQARIVVTSADSQGGPIDVGATFLQPSYPSAIQEVKFTADTSLVQASAVYTVEYTLVVPLVAGSCLIYVNFPYPDFNLAVTPVTAIDGFGMTGPSRSFAYVANANLNQIIITDACRTYFYETSLYSQTFNFYGLKNPSVAKTTAAISMQVWDGAGGQVAELKTDNSPTF